ncbi:MAG: hypothetical protein E3J70_01655 [Candidatus Heimdallarchaeota archaeon]|nr:MAG: hypothetical protein E3J70_01655 [Candidatus Heimdallarchaeota archaeon]
MRAKRKLIIGVMLILLFAPIIFFSVTGIPSKKFYHNTELQIQTNAFDSLLIDDRLHIVHVEANNVNYQIQKITGEILEEQQLESVAPINLQLYVNGSVMVVYESEEYVFYSDFNNTIRFGHGENPRIFKNTNELYLAFIRNTVLYCHKFAMPDSLWVIDSPVDKFTITGIDDITYVTYTKSGVIYYRICDHRLWNQPEQFQYGLYPTIVPTELEMRYLYYFSNDSLQIGYGLDKLTHNKKVIEGTISYICAYSSIPATIVFVKDGAIYLQELNGEGISDFYLICEGLEPKLHFYKDLILIIYRDGRTYYSLIINQSTKVVHDFFDVKLDSLSTLDTQSGGSFEDWYRKYNEYYSLKWFQDWEPNSQLKEWIVENPFWVSIILYTFILLGVLALILSGRYVIRQIQSKRSEVLI